jgi:hypothetical protein
MRFLFATIAAVVFAMPAMAQDFESKIEKIKANLEAKKAKPKLSDQYWSLRKAEQPFVVTVGFEASPIKGFTVIREDAFPAKSGSVVLVMRDASYRYDPPVTAQQLRIDAGLEVQPVAIPFGPRRRGELLRIADGDQEAAGPWPTNIPKWEGMISYRPARYTQRVFNRTKFDIVPRSNLEQK